MIAPTTKTCRRGPAWKERWPEVPLVRGYQLEESVSKVDRFRSGQRQEHGTGLPDPNWPLGGRRITFPPSGGLTSFSLPDQPPSQGRMTLPRRPRIGTRIVKTVYRQCALCSIKPSTQMESRVRVPVWRTFVPHGPVRASDGKALRASGLSFCTGRVGRPAIGRRPARDPGTNRPLFRWWRGFFAVADNQTSRIAGGMRKPLEPIGQGKSELTQNRFVRIYILSSLLVAGLAATGCQKKPAAAAAPAMQGLPVQTVTVSMSPVAQSSEYVSTIKSRRSATLQPQVSGSLTSIGTRSGDHVKGGQVLMQIDARQQHAYVESQRATERQKKALLDYNTVEVDRQHKLFDAGVTSRDAFDQAQQAYENAKADYESAVESRKTQEQLLAYYTILAPYDGVVGDIPVHVGDYVTTSTMLTTVDENRDLEA